MNVGREPPPFSTSVPPLILIGPVAVLLPLKVSVPVPDLVSESARSESAVLKNTREGVAAIRIDRERRRHGTAVLNHGRAGHRVGVRDR